MEEDFRNFYWNPLRFSAVFGPRISIGLWAVADSFDLCSLALV